MGKFDGVLICTDLDGTLFKNDKTVSDENKKAIEYFKNEGGIFTFVTGRMPFFVDDVFKKVSINAPFGCINGGGLYDYSKHEYIWKSTMPNGVNELIKCIDEKFDNVGIQVNTFDKIYFSKENEIMVYFRNATGVGNIVRHYTKVTEPVAKIVFGIETEEELQAVKATLDAHPMAKSFDFVRSERTLYEILPKNINKGTAIDNLCRCLDIDKNKTIAIGDYNNDIPMFKAAKIGIAVSNACEDALNAADYVTVSNEEHAVARVIYDLADGKYIL